MTFPRHRIFSALVCGSLGGAAIGGLTSCPGDGHVVVAGTGPIVQEQREFRPIERVEVLGQVDLSIQVLPPAPGALPESTPPETMVFLEGASDLLHWVETTLDGDTLTLRFRDDVRLDPLPSIEVQTGRLVEVSTLGSGDVRLMGVVASATRGHPLEISALGSGDVHADGACELIEVSHFGSGDIDLRKLVGRVVSYSGMGSGDAWLQATDSLTSSLAGSGDVFLLGDAPDERVQSSTLGSGKLVRLRDR